MTKNFLILSLFLISFAGFAIAQEASDDSLALKINNIENINLKNPFASQLPVETKVEEVPQVLRDPFQNQPLTITPDMSQAEIEAQQHKSIQDSLAANISISGVIWNSDRNQAIINGQVLSQGDVFLQFQIATISKEQIVLVAEGQEYIITP